MGIWYLKRCESTHCIHLFIWNVELLLQYTYPTKCDVRETPLSIIYTLLVYVYILPYTTSVRAGARERDPYHLQHTRLSCNCFLGEQRILNATILAAFSINRFYYMAGMLLYKMPTHTQIHKQPPSLINIAYLSPVDILISS